MLTLLPATPADCALIRSLADEVFPATYRELISPAQMDYMMERMYGRETLLREMREGFAWFIAFLGDANGDERPCGYLSIERQAADLFHLQKLYVLSRFQGRGIGERLFREAVVYIRAVHPTPCRMELNVNRRNRAVGFYELMGMHKLRTGDFPIGEGFYMNDYIMGLDLV